MVRSAFRQTSFCLEKAIPMPTVPNKVASNVFEPMKAVSAGFT